MITFDIPKALASLRPGAEWVVRGTEIEWLDSTQTQPTDAEIQAEITRLQADYDAKQYARDRVAAYPSIGDQLDDLFHSGAFSTEMAAKLQAVKDQFPKE